MMKYSSFLVISCLIFNLPTVEGQQQGAFIPLLGILLNFIFFTAKRNERDCKALILSSGVNDTCYCRNNFGLGPQISFYCVAQRKCLSPSDSTYCSDSTYSAYSKDRKRLALNTIPDVREEKLTAGIFSSDCLVDSRFEFSFARGDAGSPSSNKYTNCSAYWVRYDSLVDVEYGPYHCTSCDICDSGVDFKYNCSDVLVDGEYAFGNETSRQAYYPGPLVDSCFPIADFIYP